MLTICVLVIAAYCWIKLCDTYFEAVQDTSLKWWNPLVWPVAALALIMYPFIWVSERHLPKGKRSRL